MVARTLIAIVAVSVLFAGARANTEAEEIDYLISAIAQSDCTFIRNGKRHDAVAAAEHLRMKAGRAKRHATNADNFIERLASKSSMSGKPYQLECDDQAPQETGPWLTDRLTAYREKSAGHPE